MVGLLLYTKSSITYRFLFRWIMLELYHGRPNQSLTFAMSPPVWTILVFHRDIFTRLS
jgi:hypothetical protein